MFGSDRKMWETLNGIEIGIILFLQQFQNPVLNFIVKAISFLGNPIFWFFVAAFLYWRGKKILGFFCMNVIVISSALSGFLKALFMRPRPNLALYNAEWFGIKESSSYAFPSGHSLLASSFAFFFRNKVLFVIACAVAFSRIFLGLHFLSDVLFGLFLGFILGYLIFLLKKRMPENFVISIKKEVFLLTILLILSFLSLVFFNKFPILGVALGFYAGFILEINSNIREMNLLKIGIGYLGLLVFSLLALIFSDILQFIIFFIAGLWVSLLWPKLERKI